MSEQMFVMPIQMVGQKIPRASYSDAKFEEYALTHLRRIFEEQGIIRPIAEITVVKDPETQEVNDETYTSLVMMPTAKFDAHMKDVFSRAIRQIVSDLDAVSYMFASEVWMVVRGPLEVLKTRPVDAPDRQECLYVIFEFKSDYSTKMYTAPITRPDENTVRLGEWELASEEVNISGRFASMFRTSTDVS